MKLFYTKTYNVWNDNIKKQDIVAKTATKMQFDEVSLFKFDDKYDSDDELYVRMQGITSAVGTDSIVIFQYPSMVSMRYDSFVMEHLKNACGVKVAVFVQDIGNKIVPHNYPNMSDEIELFNKADLLILQSKEMLLYLKEHGLRDVPVIFQKIWDYPYDFVNENVEILKRVESCKDISLQHMLDLTQFGIVACGENIAGSKYDLMVNPFEIGFCICAGIPMIVPENTNMADFVSRYGIGFIKPHNKTSEELLDTITTDDMEMVVKQEKKLASVIADGMFTKKLLSDVVCTIVDNSCRI